MKKYQEEKTNRENTEKNYSINIHAFLKIYRTDEGACKFLMISIRKYMDSAILLGMYDLGERTIQMVINEREYYVRRTASNLERSISTLLYLNTIAKQKTGERILSDVYDRNNYNECVELITSFDRAICELFSDEYTEAQEQQVLASILEIA